MSEEIIKVLDNLGEKFGIAIDWTSQNVVSYIEDLTGRYIAYNNLIAIVQLVISIILIILGIVCIRKLIKWAESENYNDSCFSGDSDVYIMGIIGAVLLIALGTGLIIGNTMGIIQNVHMPEITILNYIRNLT